MGVHVILDIVPQRIDPARWAAVFDELRGLLAGDHARLLGYDWITAAGVPLPVYTRSVERDPDEPADHRLCVAGDRVTLAVGEQQTIHRDLGRYLGRCAATATPPDDILLAAAGVTIGETSPSSIRGAREAPESLRALPAHPVPNAPRRRTAGHVRDGIVQVLGGAPCVPSCTVPLLAAAMLVEARFPRAALVHGDVDRDQADAARRWAERVVGRPVALPVRADAWRLVERLGATLSGAALMRAVHDLHLATPAKKAAALLSIFPRAEAEPWWLDELGEATLARDDRAARALAAAHLEATRDLPRLCGLVCLDGRGPRWTPEALVAQLAELVPSPDEAALDHALRVVFGTSATRLSTLFRERRAHPSPAAGRVSGAEDDGLDDLDRLLTLSSPADLAVAQREQVHAAACLARAMRQQLDARSSESPSPAPAGLHRAFAALLGRGGPTLTEAAWEWILREEDVALLRFLVALAALAPSSDGGRPGPAGGDAARVRRALFENRALCRYAAAVSHDEALMAAVAARNS